MRQGRRTAQMIGAQRAAAAANGVAVDFGSMADLQSDTRMIGLEDAATLRKNAAREAQGYEISAWNRKAGASANRAAGGAAMWAGALDAAGTLLSAGASYAKANQGGKVGGKTKYTGGKSSSPLTSYDFSYQGMN